MFLKLAVPEPLSLKRTTTSPNRQYFDRRQSIVVPKRNQIKRAFSASSRLCKQL
uniref:Uncharacterized protein n=1 Tax=Nelumbo nucifera TaxID=4432 RepID=A0A822ZLF2_NELNU|nr:TPA_asm: hypothetical protein HUJ06_002515 [Nelumbo nucifera]